MARANRHHLSGYVWHITHRCHKREFLLKFDKDKRSRGNLCLISWFTIEKSSMDPAAPLLRVMSVWTAAAFLLSGIYPQPNPKGPWMLQILWWPRVYWHSHPFRYQPGGRSPGWKPDPTGGDNRLALAHPQCAIESDTMALANEGVLAGLKLGFLGYNWVAHCPLPVWWKSAEPGRGIAAYHQFTGSPGWFDRSRPLHTWSGCWRDPVQPAKIMGQLDHCQSQCVSGRFRHVIVNGVTAFSRGKRTPDHNWGTLLIYLTI